MKPLIALPQNKKSARQPVEKTKKKLTRRERGPQVTPVRSSQPSIELYEREESASSHVVRNRLSRLGLDYVAHTIPMGNALKHEMLVQAAGQDQIPFLIDHRTGTKLFGQRAICGYLEKEYGKVEDLLSRTRSRLHDRVEQIAWLFRIPYDWVQEPIEEARSRFRKSRHAAQA